MKRCTPLILLILGALMLAVSPAGHNQAATAAEASNAGKSDTTQNASGKDTPDKTTENGAPVRPAQPSTQQNKSKDKEIFIPSEEISEDFAVSFPVDI